MQACFIRLKKWLPNPPSAIVPKSFEPLASECDIKSADSLGNPVLESADGIQAVAIRKTHIRPLDGVRGLAVLMVMLFHFSRELNQDDFSQRLLFKLLAFGGSGVDLFFVLSGFLITGILVDSREHHRYFISFYARRVLRIFPIYYATLILLFWIGPALWPAAAGELPLMSKLPIFAFYLQNWLIDPQVPQQGFVYHFWSLAVEEQFYIFWPLLVWLVPPRRLLAVIVGGCLAVLGLRIGLVLSGLDAEVLYRNTFTRLDPLLMGAACSLFIRSARWKVFWARHTGWMVWAPAFAFVALTLIDRQWVSGTSFVHQESHLLVGLPYSAFILAIVLTLDTRSLTQCWLSWGPLVRLGRYSYGAYVFHIPVYASCKLVAAQYGLGLPGLVYLVLAMAITIAVSAFSFEQFERRFLALKDYFQAGSVELRDRVAGIA
jgi:peptidoglycan/LPS O-acetylase OafA/YrhL